MAPGPTPRRRSLKKRLAFAAVATAISAVLVEAASAIAWWAATGSMFTWGGAAAARAIARAGNEAAATTAEPREAGAQQAAAQRVVVHPYFGFVNDASQVLPPPFTISPYGFADPEPPLRTRGPDRFVVGIVGGSVAQQFGALGTAPLAAALQRSPKLAGRRIEFVSLGVSGYKQPQQLLVIQMLLLLGGQFDCIVALDGFNEVALPDENVPHGVPPWFPRSWARLLDTVPSADQQLRLGHVAWLRAQRAEHVEAASRWWWWSPTAQLLWWWQDRATVREIVELRATAESAAAQPSFAVTGPGAGNRSVEDARHEMAALWARASRELHALCVRHGIVYCHLLQPNQYAGQKVFGAAEAKVAIDRTSHWCHAVERGYPTLRREGEALAADGVPFTDLTGIFADHPEPVYIDTCCHLGSHGYAILAANIAAAIRLQIELAGVQWRGLELRPERLDITSPLGGIELAVTGLDAAGGRHDVSAAGLGTRFESMPSGHVLVSPSGIARAVRRGAATLRVRFGETSVDVPVAAHWPDIVVGKDGEPGPDGSVPGLLVEPGTGRGELTARVTNLPAAAFCFLVASPQPLPDSTVGASLLGLQVVPLVPPVSGAVRVANDAAPGEPLFLRAYALAEDALRVVARTPTVVVTRD